MTDRQTHREIPYNYTSADDRQAVLQLLGPAVWAKLEELRSRRVTGRSARLLLRVLGEVFIHRRNPFLYQELVDSGARRRRLWRHVDTDLEVIASNSGGDTQVHEVLRETRALVDAFRLEVEGTQETRARISAALGRVVGRENVLFDPFTLVSHATDATDWRLHLPAAVVMPADEAQVAPLLAAIGVLGLKAIPRGAGTGLTGGAVPLRPGCVVVNTEKLDRIRGITERQIPRGDGTLAAARVMEVEAGVITERAIEEAAEHRLVFATDPTSAWACTIGGNIAENAGGKTAVLWGTCIDNLVSWRMAMPTGERWTVRRASHPLRKILPDDLLRFEVVREDGEVVRAIELRGSDIRKKGLWKDITNKALGGVPGLQKEGTDGVVTSAEFVLHPAYAASRTLCLEFFGPDMDEASKVILDLAEAFPNRGAEVLQALEHFDAEYVRAIEYQVKAARAETPKAVLLVDVVGRSAAEAERGVATVRRLLERHGNTEVFIAADAAEAKRFWADRKKLGAIARHTNAFKLNEDIVLPLASLAEFARFCDAVNLEEDRHNQQAFARRAIDFLRDAPSVTAEGDARFLSGKLDGAVALCQGALGALARAGERDLRDLSALKALRRELTELLRGYPKLVEGVDALWKEVRSRRIVLATHMHAGDGNVHVNIPVMSNDQAMMRRAERAVDLVMEKVAALGGVPSGEHGIGVTKLKYLEPERLAELARHRREVDPRGLMNPGKLEDLDVLEQVFTPSFNLLELEARILQHGQLEELAQRIAKCVRCGKCKPDCCVFHPATGLFFHPRNKNLAIGSLVEALLYDAQRERSTSFELLRWLEEVADHCTICHKCARPCPVSIDTGEVSVLERQILVARGYKNTAPATRLTLGYLDSQSKLVNLAYRGAVVRLGGALQRAMARLAAPLQPADAKDAGYALQMLRSPVPQCDPGTLRDVLPECGPDQVLLLEPAGEARRTVFYFPGCGSERLHSSVAMAAIHLLVESGTRVIVPPPFLCCGFPAYANARVEQHGRTVLRDTILFSQIREMLGYLTFDACVVTCGTCREALRHVELGRTFGCDVVDVARFALGEGLRVDGAGAPVLYHTPCHDSLDGQGPQVLAKLGGFAVERTPHCCSEAGTLALSRPDITDAMLQRKRAALEEALRDRPGGATLLTNCPSCMQGLGRNAATGAAPKHVAVELAERLSGAAWMDAFRATAARAKAIHF